MSFHRLPPAANRALVFAAAFTFVAWTLAAALCLTWSPARAFAEDALALASRSWNRGSPQARQHAAHARVQARVADAVRVAARSGLVPTVATGYSYSDDEDGFAWMLADGDGHVTVRSRTGATRRLDGPGPAFWFQDGAREYVVRDPALVAEVERAMAPLRELGAEMRTVGRELGREGAALGRRGGRMATLGARMARAQARLAEREARRGRAADARAEMEALREQMDRVRADFEAERDRREGAMKGHSQRLEELSARHRERVREVRERVREIARRALREGKAERPHVNA